jgi:hypothetical protein
MNQLLMQMIAARTSGNSAMANILNRMQSGDTGTGVDIQEILQQHAATNPTIALLAKQLAEQKARQVDVIDVSPFEEQEESIETEEGNQEPSSDDAIELRGRLDAVTVENQVLRNRNDALAAAVGACCLCWGQDLNCRSCRGRGGPGFCMPDEALFEEFVLPAIRTLRAQRAMFAGDSSSSRSQADRANA